MGDPEKVVPTPDERESGLLEHYRFESTAQRDRLMDEFWPKRACSDTPGVYDLPDGRQLSVFCEDVRVWAAPSEEVAGG